jgi:plastocyanin
MKSLYTLLAVFPLYFSSFATTWNVSVANFTFSPSTVNAIVGDVIKFNWVSGSHTTTCGAVLPGTSLPAGATGWDADINTSNKTFSYTVTTVGTYFYGCTPHFDFGMTGTIQVSGALPVSLGMFKVVNDNNTATLSWKTFTESNTDHFSIRRSVDGRKFLEIGKVPAAGNSSVPVTYQFSDTKLGTQNRYLYYELVTVDKDQKENHSEIKVIRNAAGGNNLLVSLSPNPITRPGQVQIQFNSETKGSMQVKVYSSSGKLVLQDRIAAFYGLNSGHLHVCDLQKGVYTLQFELDKRKETRKIAVL